MAETGSAATGNNAVKLSGLFASKLGMSAIYGEAGEYIPVTILKYEPLVVSQVKTTEKDGYEAVQVAGQPKRLATSNKAERGHLKKAGLENGARLVRELRQSVADVQVGALVSLESFAAGDTVKVTATSKGKGFAGSVRRWNFAGGPAAHGSKFHRQPGSSGNRTWPGRVMPGKKFPGHLGSEVTTVKNCKVVRVDLENGVLFIKGPVPGGRHSLVKLVKE